MATEHTPLPYAQAAVDLALTEYGLQTDGHRLLSCGAHTGHTVKDMALAISPEVADYIKRACNSHYQLISELTALADLFEHAICTPGYGQDENSREEAEGRLSAARAALKLAGGQQCIATGANSASASTRCGGFVAALMAEIDNDPAIPTDIACRVFQATKRALAGGQQ